ncbi:MAG: hypothetical protein HRU38_05415 [Saccharospirillaceae bacterium]|nr:hypothetical protein [Pseudomonadales bacterium]NRB78095.1 hypothetical protein [Saccharospirillaceae bacterium]
MSDYIAQIIHTLNPDLGKKFDDEFKKLHSSSKVVQEYLAHTYDVEFDDFDPNDTEDIENAAIMVLVQLLQGVDLLSDSDWSGEYENELTDLTQKAFDQMNISKQVKNEVESWVTSLDWEKIKRGDFIQLKFYFLGEMLKEYKLHLTLIESRADCYYAVVLNEDQKNRLQPFYDTQYTYHLTSYQRFENAKDHLGSYEVMGEIIKETLDNSAEFQDAIKEMQTGILDNVQDQLKQEQTPKTKFRNSPMDFILFAALIAGVIYQIYYS